MPKNVLDNFIKQYDGNYQHTTMVRHKGVVIAFAMDNQRRITYNVLDLSGGLKDSTGAAAAKSSPDKETLDKERWVAPDQLIFPSEIAEVGFGVADQTAMPVFMKGGAKPEPFGTTLPSPDGKDSSAVRNTDVYDYFLSTTARLTALAPFQTLSDGQYVYVFRQAIPGAGHPNNLFKRNKDGSELKLTDAKGNVFNIPLVDSTLLVDRFLLVGNTLRPKMEVRYQRSRSRVRPASRKDSLGAADLDGNPFFEPTQELKFIGHLRDGGFSALLLPTQVAEVQRWQIFVSRKKVNEKDQVVDTWVDSYNVERSADGLFNTRGSQTYTCVDHPEVYLRKEGACVEPSLADPAQPCDKALIPRIITKGYAESAIELSTPADQARIVEDTVKGITAVKLGASFTLEAWIKPKSSALAASRSLIGGGGGVSIVIVDNTKLRVSFDGQKTITTKSILTPNEWSHFALTFDRVTDPKTKVASDLCRFYINGRLREESAGLNGGKSSNASIATLGAGFAGAVDEIRVWNHARSAREFRADMNQRLTGQEPDLAAYWRFDEALGNTVYDQASAGAHATLFGPALKFSAADDRVTLGREVNLSPNKSSQADQNQPVSFTLETWIKPAPAQGAAPAVLFTGAGGTAVTIESNTNPRLAFGDFSVIATGATGMLTPDKWSHVAVTFDGDSCRFYLNGRQHGVESKALSGAKLINASITTFGAIANAFKGMIGEVRIWNRARTADELLADMNRRLKDMAAEKARGLTGYWTFDEASGNTVLDRRESGANGTIFGDEQRVSLMRAVTSDAERVNRMWIGSGAPVGEHPGVQRCRFGFDGRGIASGPASLLYYQQADASSGYDGKKKPLKQNGRVMLAVATNDGAPANAGKNLIAALDFGVSATGRLAQTPDVLSLGQLNVDSTASGTLNDLLDQISDLQSRFRLLDEDVQRFDRVIATLNILDLNPLTATAAITTPAQVTDGDLLAINNQAAEFVKAFNDVRSANGTVVRLNEEVDRARATFFQDLNQSGQRESFGVATKGIINTVSLSGHALNKQISSVRIHGPLGVILMDERNTLFGNFNAAADKVENNFNLESENENKTTVVELFELEAHKQLRTKAETDLAAKQGIFNTAKNKLGRTRESLREESRQKTEQRSEVKTDLDAVRSQIISGASATMPLVHTDPFGLTISGGLLGFAWTNDGPLLFDSASGSLALYFRGSDDQFFAASYDTKTERARFDLKPQIEFNQQKEACVTCLARSTGAEMDKIKIKVEDGDSAALCNVTVAGAGIVETWKKVPRNPKVLADVLNGLAGEHTFIGRATLEIEDKGAAGKIHKLTITDRTASAGAIPAGATVLAGDIKIILRQALPVSASFLTITDEDARKIGAGKLPLFFVGYDYSADASTTKVPADLSDGSALVFAVASNRAGQRAVENQDVPGGSTLVCKWTADAPGSTLAFDGAGQCAELSRPDQSNAEALKTFKAALAKFKASGDLTMEAWVRPGRVKDTARVIHHRSDDKTPDQSAYTLGLERADMRTALAFNGAADFVEIPSRDEINFDTAQNFTVEAWIKADPQQPDTEFVDNDIIEKWSGRPAGYPFVIRYLNESDKTFNAPGSIFAARFDGGETGGQNPKIISKRKLNDGLFHHVAFVKEGAELRLYIDGILDGVTTDTTIASTRNTSAIFLGCRAGTRNRFKGELDEVRVWKRARTQAAILADMHRRLGGNETDLAGYWHFDGMSATDYSRNQNNGVLKGGSKQTVSPLPAYKVFGGVNDQVKLAPEVIPAGNWTHLAAAYDQAYGMKFSGSENDYLDCGNDSTLDIGRDLTIEVFLQVADATKSAGLISRGRINDAQTDQDVPYALYLGSNGKVRFAFEDSEHKARFTKSDAKPGGEPDWIQSDGVVGTGFCKIAVTRARRSEQVEEKDEAGKVIGAKQVNAYDEITFYINEVKSGSVEIPKKVGDVRPPQPVDAGSSNQPLEIGRGFTGPDITVQTTQVNEDGRKVSINEDFAASAGAFNGTIAEVRIWNTARDHFVSADGKTVTVDPKLIGKKINNNEKGLVSWWRFQEGGGNRAFDSKSQNHAAIHGATWVASPDPNGSSLTLYINGEIKSADPVATHALKTTPSQFTIGALRTGDSLAEFFQGEMEEMRIWRTTRTAEQIQDNLFRSLVERKARGSNVQTIVEEQEDLIAYYTFDASAADRASLDDSSLRGNNLTVTPQPNAVHSAAAAPSYVISTAPISGDTPQVRSALAGVRNPFHGLIGGTPAVQEYADMQTDGQGNLIGVFKRCYSIIRGAQWQLITGYKVGEMATEWIGQVQFAPELIGYIEGAPPVPSENLTMKSVEGIGDADDYNQASTIELVEAEETTYTYASSRDKGFDMSVDFNLGLILGTEASVGFGLITKSVDVENVIGLRAQFEHSQGWLEDASASVGRTAGKSTSLELRGRFTTPAEEANEQFGRRFVPDNVGQALVKSETADVIALRLRRNGALISYQMRANPDIPKDWNIISFPINPRYTKQGTLDGKIGLKPDADYPNALTYSPDSSYFKPIEAYALKNRINRAETELKTYFDQYAAGSLGRRTENLYGAAGDLAEGRMLEKLPHLHKRNLVNTYVWTADGGLFAETLETMDSQQEMIGGSYAFKGMAGIFADLTLALFGFGAKFALNALFGGHLNLTVTKTQESKSSFALNVNLDKVERDIYERRANQEIVIDTSDPARPRPKRAQGKVDAYRFMSFYLEPGSDHYDQFFARVVDPAWLEQSDDPGAVALREARGVFKAQTAKKSQCWRVLHRVTYVSRVLPPLDLSAPPSLEKSLQTLDIDSNFELIKTLEPFVAARLGSFAELSGAVHDALTRLLPELLPHEEEIKEYLSHYFGAIDADGADSPGDPFSQALLQERAPNQPPIVNAGPDLIDDQARKLEGGPIKVLLTQANVSDDRLTAKESFFVTWEKRSGGGAVDFNDPHLLNAEATFSERGRYVLRLTASDGRLPASDEMTVVVNQPPTIVILPVGEPQPQADGTWKLDLKAEVDTGLGDPGDVARFPAPAWSAIGALAGNITIPEAAITVSDRNNRRLSVVVRGVTFRKRGNYLLQFTAGDGDFKRDAQVMIAIAARVTGGLQALYTFQESDGATVHDVSGAGTPLDLQVANPLATNRVTGGLALQSPTILTTAGPATRLTEAVKSSNEITIEAWIKPAVSDDRGLARIVTLSNGPAERSFTLGQSGASYYAALRSTGTNANASNKALSAGTVAASLSHVVCARGKDGLMRLYLNGEEIGRRVLDGDLSIWDSGFKLAMGDETPSSGAGGAGDGRDRAWLGEYHLVAIYNRALTVEEVRQNFAFTANANLPPVVSAGADTAIEAGQSSVRLPGRVTHDRGEAVKFEWLQAAGPGSPNGVTFATRANPETNAERVATFKSPTQSGRYQFRLTADDGELMASDEVVVVVKPPARTLNLALTGAPISSDLDELVKDVASLKAGGLTFEWSGAGGPASASIENANRLNAVISFTEQGLYILTLTAKKDGRLWESISVAITVNRAPAVSAGSDRIITLPDGQTKLQTRLTGAVARTGLGDPRDALIIKWTPVSGPAGKNATIAGDTRPMTDIEFPANGVYVMRLTATNTIIHANLAGQKLADSRDVKFTINRLPVVDLGPDPALPIVLPDRAQLNAVVSDDGLPESPGAVTLQWSKASGPGDVTFGDETADITTAEFSRKGVYELQLTVRDGAVTDGGDPLKVSQRQSFLVHSTPVVSAKAGTVPASTPRPGAPPVLNVTRSQQVRVFVEEEDNGLGDRTEGGLTVAWTVSPAGAAIVDSTALDTRVSFTLTGLFTFQALVSNGFLSVTKTVQVQVNAS